jgi:hypothetical protein
MKAHSWYPRRKKEHPTDGFRIVNCEHCNRPINHTNLVDIKVFCDDGCLQDYLCDHTQESKDDLLKAIGYDQYRQEQLEEEF